MAIKIIKSNGRFYITQADDEDVSVEVRPKDDIDTYTLDCFIRGQGALVEGGLDDVPTLATKDDVEDSRTL